MLAVTLKGWMLVLGVAGVVLIGLIIGIRVRKQSKGKATPPDDASIE